MGLGSAVVSTTGPANRLMHYLAKRFLNFDAFGGTPKVAVETTALPLFLFNYMDAACARFLMAVLSSQSKFKIAGSP